jgi:hypothetical protein
MALRRKLLELSSAVAEPSARGAEERCSTGAIHRPAFCRRLPANSGARSSMPCNRSAASRLAEAGGETTRLLWAIEIGKQGQPARHQAARTEARPARLGPTARAEPRENRRQRTTAGMGCQGGARLRPERGYSNRYRLDLPTAIVALVGHPCIVLANAPEQFVDLSESQPELELVRQGDHFVMRIEPPLRPSRRTSATIYYVEDADERRETKRCA